jgi:hypothetical protein
MMKKPRVCLHVAIALATCMSTIACQNATTKTQTATPQVQFLTGFGGPAISVYRPDMQTLDLYEIVEDGTIRRCTRWQLTDSSLAPVKTTCEGATQQRTEKGS